MGDFNELAAKRIFSEPTPGILLKRFGRHKNA
jgi:hypothetical protein